MERGGKEHRLGEERGQITQHDIQNKKSHMISAKVLNTMYQYSATSRSYMLIDIYSFAFTHVGAGEKITAIYRFHPPGRWGLYDP